MAEFKMKFTAVLLFLAAVIMAACAVPFRDIPRLPRPGQINFPTFPGHGPFNPKPPKGPWGAPGSEYPFLISLS